MINRVTHQTMQQTTLANLQTNLGRMADLQGRMSSGKVITKPSDDPGGTATAMQLRAEKRAAEQFARNADDGYAWLSTVDSALQGSIATLRQARDLTVQGASSGAMGQTSRDAIATEIDGLRKGLMDQANTSYLGRSVFAGTTSEPTAFRADYTWAGTPGASVERRLSPQATVPVDGNGVAAFGEGATSVFALLDQISADLRSGTEVRPRLDQIDDRMNAMLAELATVGTRQNQVEKAQTAGLKTVTDLRGQISAVEDIDLAEVLVEIQSQEVAYKAALGAAARVLQPSLMDFLR